MRNPNPGRVFKHQLADANRALGKAKIDVTSTSGMHRNADETLHSLELLANKVSQQLNNDSERHDQAHWFELQSIKHCIDYFVELERDLASVGGTYSYYPSLDPDTYLLEEIIHNIKDLVRFQEIVNTRAVDLGHSISEALQITVTHVTDSGISTKRHIYKFTSYPDYNIRQRESDAKFKSYWNLTWHNARFHGVQRATEMRRVKRCGNTMRVRDWIGWQDRREEEK